MYVIKFDIIFVFKCLISSIFFLKSSIFEALESIWFAIENHNLLCVMFFFFFLNVTMTQSKVTYIYNWPLQPFS